MDDAVLAREALAQISAAVAGRTRPVALELRLPEPNTDFGRRLEAVANQVVDAAGDGAELSVVRSQSGEGGPALVLRSHGYGEIHYRALPVGPELPPFVAALGAAARPGGGLPVAPVDGLVALDVFISPECPNCPRSVRAAVELAAGNQQAVVRVIDVTALPDLAAAVGVRSVPTIVSGDGLTLVGAIDFPDLVKKIESVRGGDGDGVVFLSLVDAGRFAEAAKLLSSQNGRRAFIKRWGSSSLEGRIGLALTADEALAGSADTLDEMVAELLPLLASEIAPLRGDTADLLGRIGHPGARQALEGLLDDDDEDVAEVAADSLGDLRVEDPGDRP